MLANHVFWWLMLFYTHLLLLLQPSVLWLSIVTLNNDAKLPPKWIFATKTKAREKLGGAGKRKRKGERACNHFIYDPLAHTCCTFEIIRFRLSNCWNVNDKGTFDLCRLLTVIRKQLTCENIRFSSLFVDGYVSRETSPAAKSEETRMFSQASGTFGIIRFRLSNCWNVNELESFSNFSRDYFARRHPPVNRPSVSVWGEKIARRGKEKASPFSLLAIFSPFPQTESLFTGYQSLIRDTQRDYSSKPLKQSFLKRILVCKR